VTRIEIGGVEVDLAEYGTGRPLLLLHGLDGPAGLDRLVNALAANHRVIVPAFPGWAGSPAERRINTVVDLAELIGELHEGYGPDTAVVGCSLGAWVAAQMAATVSRGISALVLVSPIGVKIGGREDRDYLDIFLADYDVVARAMYQSADSRPDYASWSDEQFLHLARAEESVARYAWRPYLHDPKLIHRLRRITAPTLIVHGAEDGLVLNPALHREVAARIGAHAFLVDVDNAAHKIEEDRPDRLAQLISDFLADHSVGSVTAAAGKG
jgi:pimeloyl-ACP methyl ester carboxylesterase